MGILRDTIDSDGEQAATLDFQAPPVPAHPAPALPVPAPRVSATEADGRSDLQRRRDALAEQVTELHWDLGGLAYEMAIRDHFRLDVLVRRAAMLQERDAELAEVERLLRMEQDGVAGSCPSCLAPHSRGALYCWQCGTTLMERLPSSTAILDQ
ncbi:MAG: zinc ribbon domain-containing protein [Solirubrobacteraceae bacterium]